MPAETLTVALFALGLVLGFFAGYAVRSYVSYIRRIDGLPAPAFARNRRTLPRKEIDVGFTPAAAPNASGASAVPYSR